MKKVTYYHAGCPVCVDAEKNLLSTIDTSRFQVEIVDLGSQKSRIAEAEAAGVQSVPAIVMDGRPYHINFGAALSALKS